MAPFAELPCDRLKVQMTKPEFRYHVKPTNVIFGQTLVHYMLNMELTVVACKEKLACLCL